MSGRRLIVFSHDVLAAGIAWMLAYALRFNLEIPGEYWQQMLELLPWVLGIHALVFLAFGLYRGLWRYASLPDLQRMVIGVGVTALAVPAVLALLRIGTPVPRTVYLLTPLLVFLVMSASRIAYRAWREGRLMPIVEKPLATPVLVLGAGAAAAALLKDLATVQRWRVVGLLDDDVGKHGGEIQGVKVVGAIGDVKRAADTLHVEQAIIAMPSATHGERKRAVDLCAAAGIEVMTVPSLSDIVSGNVSVSAVRPVELDDLLGRDPVSLDDAGLHAFLQGKTVLVTGAGGSIGSELCRQIARFGPARLVLFDLSEFALYGISQEFADRGIPVVAAVGDAKDERRAAEIFAAWRPQVIFHAAAYKHVPLMEEANAFEAVRNNVLSTIVVARQALAHGSEKFVLVSTDKAVNPVNVMGASKRLAELACQALQAGGATQFVIVRFGNVLGSTGSVVPRFREQIARGGPVTVTHPDIERYFMSIPEAAQLVLQAGLMGARGEIYVLDMGEAVKIVELARELIRLSGFSEHDIKIEYTGLRPGEKLYEEPLADAEASLATPHPKLRVARARTQENGTLLHEVMVWLADRGDSRPEAVREALAHWIPEYRAAPADQSAVGGDESRANRYQWVASAASGTRRKTRA
ncbi:MAG TPA: nucleoside-diphosphate sugar epimerase/dehydratase [Burkholderiales bacterium]|nr:nucleoside-diphosphate sugar epimerase/dehydratase [Burkholderiales bacterium]